LQLVIGLIEKELSEPYPIYTYRYFVQKWPDHTFLAFLDGKCIGCIVSKLEDNYKAYWRTNKKRGYIAMLAVHPDHRRLGLGKFTRCIYVCSNAIIGRKLVRKSLDRMREQGADEVVLETEITNGAALKLYECKSSTIHHSLAFGFIRDKRLAQYYLNGNDAFKLKLFVTSAGGASEE
jgi:N-alpha-acetyltransferase 30